MAVSSSWASQQYPFKMPRPSQTEIAWGRAGGHGAAGRVHEGRADAGRGSSRRTTWAPWLRQRYVDQLGFLPAQYRVLTPPITYPETEPIQGFRISGPFIACAVWLRLPCFWPFSMAHMRRQLFLPFDSHMSHA